MARYRSKMTRKQFESLFAGQWEKKYGDRFRRNRMMITRVENGKKIWRNDQFAISAYSWREIALSLKLIQPRGR